METSGQPIIDSKLYDAESQHDTMDTEFYTPPQIPGGIPVVLEESR
jgi:hypothetical protein